MFNTMESKSLGLIVLAMLASCYLYSSELFLFVVVGITLSEASMIMIDALVLYLNNNFNTKEQNGSE